MERPFRLPAILHLTGITLKDYVPIEDVADDKVLSAADCEESYDEQYAGERKETLRGIPDSVIPYDKIPRVFTSITDWPLRTNLRCWQCDFTFDDRPKFMPTYIRANDDGSYEIGAKGNFCTFNDVVSYINTTIHHIEERWRALDMTRFVYSLFTGTTVSHIEPSEPKYRLACYGGDWDEETFWRKMRDLDPVNGLRDHTPGSVLPERERMGISAKKSGLLPRPSGESVWNVCRRAIGAPPVESVENQSVALGDPKSESDGCALAPVPSLRPDNCALSSSHVEELTDGPQLGNDADDGPDGGVDLSDVYEGGAESAQDDPSEKTIPSDANDLDALIAEMIGSSGSNG